MDKVVVEYIERIYSNTSGFQMTSNDKLLNTNSININSTYGEILPSSVAQMISSLDLSNNDVFYDLGSGTGKVVTHFFLGSPVKKSVGVELGSHRYNVSQQIKSKLNQHFNSKYKQINFLNEDMTRVDLSDGTIFYMCSTCFSPQLMNTMYNKIRQVPNLKYIITLKPLENQEHSFVKDLPMTWNQSGSKVYFYKYV